MVEFCKYIQNNYNYKENLIVFKFIEKDISEIINNTDYIFYNVLTYLCPFNLIKKEIFGKNIISFTYRNRNCDIMEYMNKYWIITMYPIV